jgi:phosphoenolpyruvate-protein phosphotransferase
MSTIVKGIGASPGIAIGPVWIYRPIKVEIRTITDSDPITEQLRLDTALQESKKQLEDLHIRTLAMVGEDEAAIFQAHAMVLEDPEFIDTVKKIIREKRINAEAAVQEGVEYYANMLLALADEYFQARAQDIQDVGRRIIQSLSGAGKGQNTSPPFPVVIAADELYPSDTVQFDKKVILGFCTVKGGPTSHVAIMARSLGVPAIVSAPFILDDIEEDSILIINGGDGTLIIKPDENEIRTAKKDQQDLEDVWVVQLASAHEPAVTTDGIAVEIVANIGSADDARISVEYGAEGVGLLRTEFLYMDRTALPTVDEQIKIYTEIFEAMGDRPVVVRTLDIGGDKNVPYLGLQKEDNPFLGWRAIRIMSERPEVLEQQLSALLQAGKKTDLRIMIPMISNLEEVISARDMLEKVKQDLLKEGKPVPEKVQFGIMVEIPSAVMLVSEISEYVDFFSIGTNDLTQYTTAVDRGNERVASLASPYHPAVIRLINKTITDAHAKGKWVGLCGEMAGDELAAPLLLGLGLDEFSMAHTSVPCIKYLMRMLNKGECEKIAQEALTLPSIAAVKNYMVEINRKMGIC